MLCGACSCRGSRLQEEETTASRQEYGPYAEPANDASSRLATDTDAADSHRRTTAAEFKYSSDYHGEKDTYPAEEAGCSTTGDDG